MKRGKNAILYLLIISLIVTGVILKTRSTESRRITIICPSDAAACFEALADAFQGGVDRPQIAIEKVERSNYSSTIEKRLSDKNPPDMVVFTADMDIVAVHPVYHFADLAPLLKASDAMIRTEGDDPLYILPLCGDIPLIFYNQTLFAKENLSEPEELNQFLSVCSYLQMRNLCPLGIQADGAGHFDIASIIDCLLVNAPVSDLSKADEEAQNDALADLLSFLESLRNMDVFSQECAEDRDQLFEAFQAGTCAMIPSFFSDIQVMDSANLPFQYGAFLLFGNSMTNRGVLIPTLSISILSDAGQPTRDFAAFLLSEEGQRILEFHSATALVRNDLSQQSEIKKALGEKLSIVGLAPSYLARLSGDQKASFLNAINNAVAGENVDVDQLCKVISDHSKYEGGE